MGKRGTIINVASKLFAEKGFDATSVRNIAEGAGISVAGMFHYFRSKEDILNEIMSQYMDEGYEMLMEVVKANVDPLEKTENVFEVYIKHYAEDMERLAILFSEGKSLTPEHRWGFEEKQRRLVAGIKEIFQDLGDADLLKPISVTILSFMFFGMVHWVRTWYNPEGIVKPEKLARIFAEVFLRGALKP